MLCEVLEVLQFRQENSLAELRVPNFLLFGRSRVIFQVRGSAARICKAQSYSINVQSPSTVLLVILSTRRSCQNAN